MLRVVYADGEDETWPIPEYEARSALRRQGSAGVPQQAPSLIFRGLRAQPIWPTDARSKGFQSAAITDLCTSLEAAFPLILVEVQNILRIWCKQDASQSNDADSMLFAPAWVDQEEGLVQHGCWQKLELWSRGRRNTGACALLPTATSIIERHSGSTVMLDPPGRAYLSLMTPMTQVSPHCGPSNHRLRLHLPVIVPIARANQPLGIKVAGTLIEWTAGKAVVFDDSFMHSVDFDPEPGADPLTHMSAQGARVVLVIDLWHPQATRWFPEHRRLHAARVLNEQGSDPCALYPHG